jgi:hypothetical protein
MRARAARRQLEAGGGKEGRREAKLEQPEHEPRLNAARMRARRGNIGSFALEFTERNLSRRGENIDGKGGSHR